VIGEMAVSSGAAMAELAEDDVALRRRGVGRPWRRREGLLTGSTDLGGGRSCSMDVGGVWDGRGGHVKSPGDDGGARQGGEARRWVAHDGISAMERGHWRMVKTMVNTVERWRG